MCKAFKKKSAEERKKEMAELMKKLEDGVKGVFDSTEYANYLRTMSKFRHYSLNNQLLIWAQCPHATAVAGFNDWKRKFGRTVKKGEHGIKILAPMPIKIKAEEEQTDENGVTTYTEEIERIITLYKTVSVFDVSQTEGNPLPEFDVAELTGKVSDYDSLLQAIVQAAPCNVYFEEITNGSKGYYSVIADKVVVNTGMSQEQTIKTCLHEVAHAILHNREKQKNEPIDRPTKEVEAESIAFLVSDAFGVNTESYSFKYVASWSSEKSVPELKASLEKIKTTATDLIDKIEKLLSGAEFSSEKGGSTSSNEEGNAVCVG